MSLFQFFLTLFFCNFLCIFILLFVSVYRKSPKIFLRYFFLSIMLCTWFALIVQQITDVAYLSTRQLLGNVIVSIWVVISFFLHKNLKLSLLSDYLRKFKDALLNKQLKSIILLVLYASLLQMICFSPIVSLNFLSGPSYFNVKDLLSLIICIAGILMYLQSTKELKLTENQPRDRLLEHIIHPDYLGNLIFFIGLFLLSSGATGGTWSIIGLIVILFIMDKVIIPENKRRVLEKNSINNL